MATRIRVLAGMRMSSALSPAVGALRLAPAAAASARATLRDEGGGEGSEGSDGGEGTRAGGSGRRARRLSVLGGAVYAADDAAGQQATLAHQGRRATDLKKLRKMKEMKEMREMKGKGVPRPTLLARSKLKRRRRERREKARGMLHSVTLRLQTWWRMAILSRRYRRRYVATGFGFIAQICQIQAIARGRQERARQAQRHAWATTLQTRWRKGAFVRCVLNLRRNRRLATTIQCFWRTTVARLLTKRKRRLHELETWTVRRIRATRSIVKWIRMATIAGMRRRRRAATLIQIAARAWIHRRYFRGSALMQVRVVPRTTRTCCRSRCSSPAAVHRRSEDCKSF